MIHKIIDIAKELQTSELKLLIYRQIEKFVYKYHTRYFPHFKGDLRDLTTDIFEEFCRPKKHRNGEVFSELDRMDPDLVGGGEWTGDDKKAIATYTQRYVIARLIDKERTNKDEVRASENYEEGGDPSLDKLNYKHGIDKDSGMVSGTYIENINKSFSDLMSTPQAIENAKKYLKENPEQVKRIKYLLKHYNDKLDVDVKEFIENFMFEVDKETSVKDKIKSKFEDPVEVKFYKKGVEPVVRVSFKDADTMKKYSNQDEVAALLKDAGFHFNKAYLNNWYFTKTHKAADSVSEDEEALKYAKLFDRINKNLYYAVVVGVVTEEQLVRAIDNSVIDKESLFKALEKSTGKKFNRNKSLLSNAVTKSSFKNVINVADKTLSEEDKVALISNFLYPGSTKHLIGN